MRGASQVDVFRDLALDILLFPVWWYSRGVVRVAAWSRESFFGYARLLAIDVWMKNVFVPMFGQYDWQSRLISIFMRLVQIIGRSFALLVITLMILMVGALYLVALPVVTAFTAYHLVGFFLYVV